MRMRFGVVGLAALMIIARTSAWAHAGHKEVLKMLADYEAVRAALAEDDLAAATKGAERLMASAKAAGASVAGRTKPQVEAIGKAAEQMSKTDPDAAKLRRAFGELSRQVVAYLVKDPGIARGFTVFECRMADGYGKWVQPGEKMGNPYMGKAAPDCGAKSEL
jgi:hypothetical protein